jgi:hypothetical protein
MFEIVPPGFVILTATWNGAWAPSASIAVSTPCPSVSSKDSLDDVHRGETDALARACRTQASKLATCERLRAVVRPDPSSAGHPSRSLVAANGLVG